MEEEQELEKRKKRWWGHFDIENTACAREALIHGIAGGMTVGVLYFMRSGIIRRSCDFAVGGFALASFISWEVCRMSRAKERAEMKRTVSILNRVTEMRREELRKTQSTSTEHPPPPPPSSPSDS